jgi:two-component system, OmpR family, response regulator
MRVLMVEDEPVISEFVANGLREAGHNVDQVSNGSDGLHQALHENYDAIVLDRMLPGIDGIQVMRRLREGGNRTPVLMLSSLGDVEQRVEGLRSGADDYLAKPFAFVEVLARLEALLRRESGGAEVETQLRVADLHMDLLKRVVHRGDQLVDVQPREFRLLEYLMRHADQVVTRTMLLEAVWDYHFDPQSNVIDVHISRLRQKIDRDRSVPLLHTVRGSGYLLGIRN